MLTLNSNSLQVVRLQLQLRQTGHYDGLITGMFDDNTRIAVKAFQRAYNLTSDGIAGPRTQTVINTICANGFHILFLHCAASPEGRITDTADTLILGHMLPNKANGCLFMGQNTTIDKVIGQRIPLTNGKFYTITGRELSGRGWSRPGYSDVIELSGKLVNIFKYNEDDFINEWEQTWGVHGSTLLNRNARHVCYIGGMSADMKQVKDTRTKEQTETLTKYVLETIEKHPNIIVAGHNQVQNKACPSFDVPQWLGSIGVHEYNIGQWSNRLRI
jgi:hypothetical protein